MSPQIHNAAFVAAGIDAVYLAFDLVPDQVGAAVAAAEAMGWLGANVTVPHKRAVYQAVPRRTAAANACGAANTIYWDGDGLAVDNTDVEGLERVLRDDVGLGAEASVVVLGAGGAARAAAVALGRVGAGVEVVARRPDAAAEVEAIAVAAGADVVPSVAHPRMVINATPLGLRGERLPDRFMGLSEGQTALDMVYGQGDTQFLAAARAGGAQAMDGRGMLVGQAAASFERWTGIAAPRGVMLAAVQTALAPS